MFPSVLASLYYWKYGHSWVSCFCMDFFCYFSRQKITTFFVLCSCFSSFFVHAEENKILEKTDITRVGMDMFTTAYKWEQGSASWYTQEALMWFTKKLNEAIRSHATLGRLYGPGMCEGCAQVVHDSFDKALQEFLMSSPPSTTSADRSYAIVVAPHLDQKIRSKMTADLIRSLNVLIEQMVANISGQVREQMDGFRDSSAMGLYYDGDTNNSPYDLLDDIRKIDEIFFREVPEFWDYKNTSQNDASGIITGRFWSGTWGGWENYNIDLLSDIGEALWKKWSEWWNGSWNELAGDCEGWFCVTLDFISNKHYFLGWGQGKWNSSLQWIFERGLEWLIKNGDKRNLACKAPPTINFYESENDLNFEFSKIFSGVSIFVFWKTPTFLEGFLDRNTTTKKEQEKKDIKREDQETEDSLRRSFKRLWLDFDTPTNFKSSKEQIYQNVALRYWSEDAPAIAAVESLERWSEQYRQSLLHEWVGQSRAFTNEKETDSVKHFEKTFDEMTGRMKQVRQYNEDMKKVLTYLKEKPNCGN